MKSNLMCIAVLLSAVMPMAVAAHTPTKSVKFTTLFNFDGGAKGGNPAGSLIQGRDGSLYGTTFDGGSNNNNQYCGGVGCGTVFKISPRGKLTTLYNFCSQTNCADGASPAAPLVLGTDGNFYGITETGGNTSSSCSESLGCGTAFKITSTGQLTTLHTWCSQTNCADGRYLAHPEVGTFVQAIDGNFYGTNDYQGTANCGTFFKLTPKGTLTTLYTFGSQSTAGCAPQGLIQAADGKFYGTTLYGGLYRFGTVFKVTAKGSLATLYNFCSKANCADGFYPVAPLIQATDGNLYGTTFYGGAYSNAICFTLGSCGTAFKFTPKGDSVTTLYNFCSLSNCTDGANPDFSLVQATDNNFYGVTYGGGTNGDGTVFRLTAADKLTTLHSFQAYGQFPQALFQATSGTFFGVTLYGGTFNSCGGAPCGTVFGVDVGLGPFVALVNGAGKVGSKVDILGQGFKGTTAVSFKGTAAKFTVHSDTYLTATVPKGAATGFVTVTTSKGKLRSNKKFRVIP